jgi:hypothetical protein
MKLNINIIRCAALVALLPLAAQAEDAAISSNSDEMQRLAQEHVKETLKDPFSAQFRRQKGMCGEVNSKNSYGAYVGWQRYVVVAGSTVLLENKNTDPYYHTLFNDAWDSICNGITYNLPLMDAETAATHAFIKSLLKYPNDAQWRNLKGSCGEVNLMEASGIRTGWRRFIMLNKNAFAIEGESISSADFEKSWQAFCLKKAENEPLPPAQ